MRPATPPDQDSPTRKHPLHYTRANLPTPSPRRACRRRTGTVLVVAMWGTVLLAGVILVLARSMTVEATAASNRIAAVQAGAVARGAEQYVLNLCEAAGGDPSAAVDMVPLGPMQVGDGYFWIIKPVPDDETQTTFGLVDEASKLNLNSAGRDELLKLPGITNDVVDSIVDWRDTDSNVTDQGAEDDYYGQLQFPYRAKNDNFETIGELRLVKGMTDEILFGYDLNHDGILDERERSDQGPASAYNAANGAGRGIFPFVTVNSVEANAGGKANVGDDQQQQQVQAALAAALPKNGQSRAAEIMGAARRGRPFASVFDFAAKGGMTAEEVTAVYDKLTTSTAKTIQGRVNIKTAPREVMLCLPGLESADVENLISKRADTSFNIGAVYGALGPAKAAQVGAWITDKSYQYSADIVAVSGNGRAFKRVRMIVDARSTPAKVVFHKDVSDLGFPYDLDPDRQTLKDGGTLDTTYGSGATGGSGF